MTPREGAAWLNGRRVEQRAIPINAGDLPAGGAMTHGVCYVSWCPSFATGSDQACSLHRKRPVLHNHETREQWMTRVRQEDAAAKRLAAKVKREAEEAARKRGRVNAHG